MANIYQQAATRRKISYLAAILVLLVLTLFVRGTVKVPVIGASIYEKSIEGQARKYELTELSQGDAELGGAAVNLLLTGSRGLAVCALWNSAIDKQKKHEWNELDVAVKSITTLQPHFAEPWLFQSWNLAYNVSVEMDRLNDMYFYIARGITTLAEGEAQNRNNPNLRYFTAFYYQNKFGTSDKMTSLRCFLQMSCIPDDDRNYERLLNADKSINADALEEFCRANPHLIRRLKETRIAPDGIEEKARPLATSAEAVVAFLRNNRKLPSRYQPGTKVLKTRLGQFPVMPDFAGQVESERELKWSAELSDSGSDAFQIARGWYFRANDAIPPPNAQPGGDTINPDPFRYRIPRRPSMVIFRQGPPRAQTYVAERLTKEGWFDNSWEIDDPEHDQAIWIKKTDKDGKPVSARFTTDLTAQAAWVDAAERWRRHGKENGLALDPAELARYMIKAEEFMRIRPGTSIGTPSYPLLADEAKNPAIVEAHAAHRAMNGWLSTRTVTNYESFQVEADAMSTPEAADARRLFFRADRAERVELDVVKAASLYEQAFDAWKKVLSKGECRTKLSGDEVQSPFCHDFRDLEHYHEETYEKNLRYLKILMDRDLSKRRQATMLVSDLLRHGGGTMAGYPLQVSSDLALLGAPLPELKALPGMPIPGPFDGNAESDGKPWIPEDVKNRMKEKYGLIKRAPGMGGPPPGMMEGMMPDRK